MILVWNIMYKHIYPEETVKYVTIATFLYIDGIGRRHYNNWYLMMLQSKQIY